MAPKTARAISFDFDNTLLLSEACKHATMREVCARHEHGLEVLSTVPHDSRTAPPGVTVTRFTIFDGVAQGLIERGVSPPAGVGESDFGASMCQEFSSLLEQRLLQADEVPGATALLKHLAAADIPCFVNTATPQGPIDELIDTLGWRSYFRAVLGAPGTKLSNLQAIAATAGLGSPAEELVHVGDGDNDCKAAAEFGCRFVGIALDPALGGSGTPDSGFTKPCVAITRDMHEAATCVCALLGISAVVTPAPRVLRCRACVDCGFVLSERSTSWPTCKPLSREVHKAPNTSEPPGARSKQSFTLNGGSGTHIDAPSHFIPSGRTVDQLTPQELAAVPLVVIDVSSTAPDLTCSTASRGPKRARDGSALAGVGTGVGTNVGANAGVGAGVGASVGTGTDERIAATAPLADLMVGADAIRADEALHGRIPERALVCIRTGWAAARYGSAAAYYNATDEGDVDPYLGLPRMHFPGLTPEAAKLLVLERGAVGVGIDTLSPDGGGGATAGFPAHHVILGNDRYILENLHLPDALPPRGAAAFVSPLNVEGAPEAPVRVWAVVP